MTHRWMLPLSALLLALRHPDRVSALVLVVPAGGGIWPDPVPGPAGPLIDAIYRGEKPSPRSLRPEIDQELEAIILRSMHPRHEQRYDSAREFYEALEEYSARQPMHAVVVSPTVALQLNPAVAVQWSLVHIRNEMNEKHPIQGESVMVGRDRTCSIVLSHPAVSRRHARMTLNGASWILEDLKSANGTYVNNTRVERVSLKPGDVVRFGADPSCSYVLKEF